MTDITPKKLTRRDAIKILGAAAGATVLANLPSKWSTPQLTGGVLPAHAQTSCLALHIETISTDGTLSATDLGGSVSNNAGIGAPLSFLDWYCQTGCVALNISLDSGTTTGEVQVTTISQGPFSLLFSVGTPSHQLLVDLGTGDYALDLVGSAGSCSWPAPCLVEGTLVTMADGTQKKIEDIEYSDLILVWNFDEGQFDSAQPFWIKKTQTAHEYNLVEFSDGSFLKTVRGHRILNIEKGKFTYPHTDDSPLGTTTFTSDGKEITLVRKSVVKEQVNFYNVITNHHINLFANGILTSCRYNNLYPIADMKFVKEDRALISREEYGVENKYYEGLRLVEQTIPIADTVAYVHRLEALKADLLENVSSGEAELALA